MHRVSIDGAAPQDDVVVLPPVSLDPVFADAVDDAVAGTQPPTSPFDPERPVGADPHDFAGLYIRHRHSFGLHARRFLRDQRDVDEVVQEAFLRLFLALPELGSELQALSYCRRTITNLCIDRYRADQRRPRLIDLDSVPVDVLSEDELDDPVIQAEDAALVREALALLSPLHREALVKREIEEKPLPVIAAELGVPEDSVKHLLHRARRALRRRLAETHLAPGVDLDDVSTLSLLARSAVSGTGRLGVFVLLFLGLVLGATTHVPVQAMDTLSGLLRSDPPAAPRRAPAAPAEVTAAAPGAGQPAGVLGLERDLAGPVQLPAAPSAPLVPQQPGDGGGSRAGGRPGHGHGHHVPVAHTCRIGRPLPVRTARGRPQPAPLPAGRPATGAERVPDAVRLPVAAGLAVGGVRGGQPSLDGPVGLPDAGGRTHGRSAGGLRARPGPGPRARTFAGLSRVGCGPPHHGWGGSVRFIRI